MAFTYVGLSIKSYADGITIDQNQYIAGIERIPISKERALERKEELSEIEKKKHIEL